MTISYQLSKIIPDALRHFYRRVLWRILRLLRASITVKTKQGTFLLRLNAEDPISKSLFIELEHEYELMEQTVNFLKERALIDSQGTFLDIGANRGITSIGMLSRKHFKYAIAIEPEPINYSSLLENILVNQLDASIYPFNLAASNKSQDLEFSISNSNYGDHRIHNSPFASLHDDKYGESDRSTIKVNARSIDSILEDVPEHTLTRLSLIWIDVQGHEGYVIQGGNKVFSRNIPVVCEIWPYGIRRSGITAETFIHQIESTWSKFAMITHEGIVIEEISTFHNLFGSLSQNGKFENVIFLK